jgi:flagellar hook-associated protein 3 FlgL
MIHNIDPSSERFLADLARIQRSAERAMRQISSGLRVTAPSDAPDQISDILQLHASLARNAQLRDNLNRLKSEVDTAEQTIGHAVTLVERVRTLASQGVTATMTAENRRILAGEVQGLLEQLLVASQTTVEGRFVFSGDQDQAPAYVLDLTAPNGVNRLFTTQATRLVVHPSGTTFTAGRTAEQIFDHRNADDSLAADNVFAAVNAVRVALENNSEPDLDAALTNIRLAGDYLNQQLSHYGAIQNKVAEAIAFANKLELQLKTELGARQDADLASAAIELQQARTSEEVAMSARARLPRTSLFDFLD